MTQPSEQPDRDALELLASLVNRDIEAQFEELYGATLDSALFEAEAAAPDPIATLDVERLARALKVELNRTHRAGEYEELAKDVAAAYAEGQPVAEEPA